MEQADWRSAVTRLDIQSTGIWLSQQLVTSLLHTLTGIATTDADDGARLARTKG